MSASDLMEAPPRVSNVRALGPWYLADFLNSYAATLLTAGSYWYADRVLGAPPAARLWLSASWGFAYIFLSLLAGKLTERWGPRATAITMISGCIATGLLGLGVLAWPSLWTLGLAMFAYNVTSSQIWPALESAITRSPGTVPLSSRMTLYNLVWSSTGFLALATAGTLFELHPALLFVIPAAVSAIGTSMLAAYAVPASMIAREHVPDAPAGEHEAEDPAVAQRARRLLYMAWVGNALAYMAIQTLIPMVPTVTRDVGISSAALGAAATGLWPLARFFGFAGTWFWRSWHYSVRYLLGFQVLLAAAFFGILHINGLGLPEGARIPVFFVAQILFGFAAAFIYSSSLYYAMHVSAGAGGHAGIHEALIGVGVVLGPTIGAIAGTGPNALGRITLAVTSALVLGAVIMGTMGASAPRRPQPRMEAA